MDIHPNQFQICIVINAAVLLISIGALKIEYRSKVFKMMFRRDAKGDIIYFLLNIPGFHVSIGTKEVKLSIFGKKAFIIIAFLTFLLRHYKAY